MIGKRKDTQVYPFQDQIVEVKTRSIAIRHEYIQVPIQVKVLQNQVLAAIGIVGKGLGTVCKASVAVI